MQEIIFELLFPIKKWVEKVIFEKNFVGKVKLGIGLHF
jgi:hypothetical protein